MLYCMSLLPVAVAVMVNPTGAARDFAVLKRRLSCLPVRCSRLNDQAIRDRPSSARRSLERLVLRRVTFSEYLPAYYVDSAANGE
jgi:hypothetical protein